MHVSVYVCVCVFIAQMPEVLNLSLGSEMVARAGQGGRAVSQWESQGENIIVALNTPLVSITHKMARGGVADQYLLLYI